MSQLFVARSNTARWGDFREFNFADFESLSDLRKQACSPQSSSRAYRSQQICLDGWDTHSKNDCTDQQDVGSLSGASHIKMLQGLQIV